MARYAWIVDPSDGTLVPANEYYRRVAAAKAEMCVGRPMIITDIPPDQSFRSPIDDTVITSRRELAEHNARNGVADIGNDNHYRYPKKPVYKMPSPRKALEEVMYGHRPVLPAVGRGDAENVLPD